MSKSTDTTTTTTITPYQAAKMVNAALESANLSKRIPPQMMYNYTTARVNKGKAPFIQVDEKGLVLVSSLNEWIEKYVAKQVATVKVNA